MKKGALRNAIAVITTAVAVVSGQVAAQSKAPVNVGVIFPTKNIIGKQGVQGAQIAAELVNASGGVADGRPIGLIIYDTNYSPVEGVAAVQRLLTQDDVHVVVGEISSTVALAAIPVVQSEDAILVLAVPKHPDVTASGYDGVFRLNTTTEMDAKSFNAYLKSLDPKRVAILAENNDFGRLTIDNMKSLFGSALVFSDLFGVTQTDFSALASNVRGSGSDLVCIAASNPEQSGNLIKAMAEIGYGPKRCIMPGLLNNDLPKVAGKAADGVFSEDMYDPAGDLGLNRRFVDAYKAKYGQTPGKIEELGFESVWIVAQAMKAVGTNTDTKEIAAALHGRDWETPRGKVHFDAKGQASSDQVYGLVVKDGRVTGSPR